MASVDRVERPTPGAFRRAYLKPRLPAVLVGATDRWRARDWTLEDLARRLGDLEVAALVLDQGHVRMDVDHGLRTKVMGLNDYLAHLERASPPRYYLRLRLAGDCAFLRDDVEVPDYCAGSISTITSLLIGGAGTTTDLHYDMVHNFVVQLHGTRRVTLFSPADRDRLYPFPWRTFVSHQSRLRLEAVDPEAFPRFRDATPFQVDVEPGEMLFIPRGWWHHFEALQQSIAVNFFWLTPKLLPAVAAARMIWLMKRVHYY